MRTMSALTARAAAIACVVGAVLMLPLVAEGQRGGQGRGSSVPAPQPTGERVQVKAGHANVHMGPTTVNEVIVLAPKGTVLPVLARRGEWVQVAISPALRKTGMVMRWYKNEDNGWIHDSLLDILKPGER
jgi:uncharacterized protein YgiM (DUF1202 family)